jgi:hypothetical protein
MYHIKCYPPITMYYSTKINSEAGSSLRSRISQPPTPESRSPWLPGHYSHQLCKNCAGANMVHSQTEHVFILEHYFASKSFAAVCEVQNVNPDKEIPCEISSSHGGEYDVQSCLLGYTAV